MYVHIKPLPFTYNYPSIFMIYVIMNVSSRFLNCVVLILSLALIPSISWYINYIVTYEIDTWQLINPFVARFSDALHNGLENPLYLTIRTIYFLETIYKIIPYRPANHLHS